MDSQQGSTPTAVALGAKSIAIGRDAIGNIFITGDHNLVFTGDYVDIASCYVEPWQVFERVQIERFSPRPSLEPALDQFLANNDRGVLLFEGPAGLGKTSLLAHFAKDRKYIHHFVELSPGTEGVSVGTKNLAAQLILSWSLNDQVSRLVHLSSVGPEYLQNLLNRAAKKRDETRSTEPIVLLIDGLDQAASFGDYNVLGLPKHLPKGVYIVASQRPGDVRLSTTTPREIVKITAESADNLAEIRHHLAAVAGSKKLSEVLTAAGVDKERFVNTLTDKSQGVWVYVQFVIAELERGKRSPNDLDSLPAGVWHYYADFFSAWKRKNKDQWEKSAKRLIAALASIREGLGLEALCSLIAISYPEAKTTLLEDWAPFVVKSSREECFRLYHSSINDFVNGAFPDSEALGHSEQVFAETLRQEVLFVNHTIAQSYLTRWGNLTEALPNYPLESKDPIELYGKKFLVHHLAAAERWADLDHLFLSSKNGENSWFQIRLQEDDLDSFFSDLEINRKHAVSNLSSPDGNSSQPSAQVVRYGLMLSSIGSMASNVPASLVGALLKANQWSLNRALSYAERVENGELRARAYMNLLGRVTGKLHVVCLRRLVDAIAHVNGRPPSRFQEDLWRELFTNFAGSLTREDLKVVFDAVQTIEDPEARISSIMSLASLDISPELAREVIKHCRFFRLPVGDTISVATSRFRISRWLLVTEIRAGKKLPIAEAVRTWAERLSHLQKAHAIPWVDATLAFAENPNYDALASLHGLPSLQRLVDESLLRCMADVERNTYSLQQLLPLLGDKKRGVFDQFIRPTLTGGRGSGESNTIVELGKKNPDLLRDLVAITDLQHRLMRPVTLSKLLPFPGGSGDVIDRLIDSFDISFFPEMGDCISQMAPLLSDTQSKRVEQLALKVNPPDAGANSLAFLAVERNDPALFHAAVKKIEEIDDPWKVRRTLDILSKSTNIEFLAETLKAAQRTRDESNCIVAICNVLPFLPKKERPPAVDYCIQSLSGVPDNVTSARLVEQITRSSKGSLDQSTEARLLALIEAISLSVAPDAAASAFSYLVQYGVTENRDLYYRRALSYIERSSIPSVQVGLIATLSKELGDNVRCQLRAQVESKLAQMSCNDKRYALPKVASLLGEESTGRFIKTVLDAIDFDKIYALDDICPFLTDDNALQLSKQIHFESTSRQIVPALAGRLAKLGRVAVAFDVVETTNGFYALRGVGAMAPFLNPQQLEEAIARVNANKLDGDEQPSAFYENQKFEALAELYVRYAEVCEPAHSLAMIATIPIPNIRSTAELRVAPRIPAEARGPIWDRAFKALRDEPEYWERSKITNRFLDLTEDVLSRETLAILFATCLDLSSRQTRSECFLELAVFAKKFLNNAEPSVASAWFNEIRRIRTWWP